MEILVVLFGGLILLTVIGTFVAIRRDGHGHIAEVRSNAPWQAGNLPSEPYSEIHFHQASLPARVSRH